MKTAREGTAPIRPLPQIKYAVGASCGCLPALVIHEDGTRELAHDVTCAIGTAPVLPSVLDGLAEGGATNGT